MTADLAHRKFIEKRAVSDYVSSEDVREASRTHEGVATRTSRDPSRAWSDALTGRIGEIKFEQLSTLELWRYGDENGDDDAEEADYIRLQTGDLIDVKTKTSRSDPSKVYISMAGKAVDDLCEYYPVAFYRGEEERIDFVGYLSREQIREHGTEKWFDDGPVRVVPLVHTRDWDGKLGMV